MGPDPEAALATAELAGALLGGVRVEESGEGEGEDGLDLVRAGGEAEACWEEANDGGDVVAGPRHILGEAASELDVGGVEADLLLGLPECGGFGGGIDSVHAPPGEGDLARMGAEVRRAEREQHTWPIPLDRRAMDQGNEDSGVAERTLDKIECVI